MDSKNSLSWLGIQDYFNYYLPGLIWIGDLILFIILNYKQELLDVLLSAPNKTHISILIASAILIPFLVGLTLNHISHTVLFLDRILLGKPEVYVLDPSQKKKIGKTLKLNKSLGKELRENVIKLVDKKLDTSEKSSSFFPNVRYSLQIAPYPRINSHISRLTNLINLHEGLIIPMLLGAIIIFIKIPSDPLVPLVVLSFFLLIATVLSWMRYHYLRELRVKQVFRYFYLWQMLGEKIFENQPT